MVARLLSPDEVGVFAIAAALVLMAAQVKSFGMGSYLIKTSKLSTEIVRKALGIMVLLSWGIALLLLVFSSAIQKFYDIDGIQWVICILSISFFTAPFVGIHRSLLSKSLRFQEIALISVTTQTLNLVLTYLLISNGFSYYSMAIATACAAICELCLIYTRNIEFKTWKPDFSSSKDMLKFGAYSTLTSITNKGINVLPDIVLGRIGTTADVAFYSRASGLTSFVTGTIMGGIRPVSLPYLSKKNNEEGRLEEGYIYANSLSSTLLAPVLLVLGLSSQYVILFIFGEKWAASADIAFYFGISQAIFALSVLSEVPFTVRGLMHLIFARSILRFLLTFICILTQYDKGLYAIAFAFIFVNIFDYLVNLIFMKFKLGFSIRRLTFNSLKSVILCLVCALFFYIVMNFVKPLDFSPMIMIVIIGMTMTPVWLLSTFFMKLPINEELQMIIRKKG